VLEFFGGRTPTPRELLAADADTLRTAAGAKTTFLRSLAEHVVSSELELYRLAELDDAYGLDALPSTDELTALAEPWALSLGRVPAAVALLANAPALESDPHI
jgi:3-methyladenine DNA glycosylase/8-oxoguanine DNA glycosylase